jgi:hypothetical protein
VAPSARRPGAVPAVRSVSSILRDIGPSAACVVLTDMSVCQSKSSASRSENMDGIELGVRCEITFAKKKVQ